MKASTKVLPTTSTATRASQKLHLQHAFYFCSFLCRNCTTTAMRKRTQHFWPTTPNMVESCWVRLHIDKSLSGFKLCATTANNRQWRETGCANVRNIYHPTILGVVGQQCCVRLHRALRRKHRCLISRFMVDANKPRRNLLSLSEIGYQFFRKWTSGKFTYIWQRKGVGVM